MLPTRWILPLALTWATAVFAMGSPDAGKGPPPLLIDHTVTNGDTLYSIARRYGSSVELLVETNGIADVRKLQVGTLLRVPLVRPPRPSARARTRDSETTGRLEIEHYIELSEIQLNSARFRAALESADAARALLDALPDSSQRESRVRVEIVSATAYVALGDRDAALSSVARALQADPDLALDPAVVPPKVLRVFREVREAHP